jgi:hypothetical protein
VHVPPPDDPAAQDAAVPLPDAAGAEPEARTVDYQGQGKMLMERCVRDAKSHTARLLRDRADIWHHKLDRGGQANHWSIWDPSAQRYVERGSDPDKGGLPEWVPRPVTNLFTAHIDGITAILDQAEPAQLFAPKTDADEDRATSEVAIDAVPVLREECGYDSQGHRHLLNRLSALTNGVAYCLYYDNDPKYGEAPVDVYTCTVCGEMATPVEIDELGKCPNPECENTDTEAFELATQADELGVPAPMSVNLPIGRICAQPIPSVEYSLPSSCRRANAKATPWVLTHTRMAPEDIVRMWPSARDLVKDKGAKADGALTRAYADQLQSLASPQSGNATSQSGGSGEFDGVVVYRLQHDPIDDGEFYFPDGFYGVMIGEQLIEDQTAQTPGPLPFQDSEGRRYKNILIRSWTEGMATQFGHPPADDLAPLQVSYNMVDALVQLIIMHNSAPTTYVPETVTFIDEPTGVPGQHVRYRSMDGQKPTETRGINPPEALFNYLDRIKANMQEVSGLNSVLAGSRPEGDPTLGEVQILEERGQAKFRNPLDGLIQFEIDLSFMLLDIARQCAWSPRFRRIRGENQQWEIKQFAAADLSGQIDIQVDRASAWPKSPLMQQLRLKEAVSMGVLMPQMDPEVSGKLLVEMNLAHFKKSLDNDRKQVARELDRWKAARTPDEVLAAAPDPEMIELPVHIYLKKQFLKTEEAEEMRTANAPVYMAMVQSVKMLEQTLVMKQMQQAAVAAGPQPPAKEEAPPPGSGGALEGAIESGALQPAQEQPPQALDGAVSAGVLSPGVPTPMQGPSVDDLLEAGMLRPVREEEPPPPPM